MKINSNRYWDSRFEKDWSEYGGGDQSRYFARVLIESLPEWLKSDVRESSYSICDWGCAQGDGTDIFSSVFNRKVVGIDFSSIAVEQAKEKYTSSDFLNVNLLDDVNCPDVTFDVVMSSNTLEHFHEPFKVLDNLKHFAKNLLILSVPYEELERIDEHHFTFLADNIPLSLGKGWKLLIHRVVDCRNHNPSFWPGKQITLVYCRQEWLESKSLKISDVTITSSFDALYYSEELFNKKEELNKLSSEKSELLIKLADSEKELEYLRKINSESIFKKLIRRISGSKYYAV